MNARTRFQGFLSLLFLAILEVSLVAANWSNNSFRRTASTIPSPSSRRKSFERKCVLLTTFRRQNIPAPSSSTTIRAGAVAAPATAVFKPVSYYLRVALAGGLAGATGTVVLYPMDSAKTLRQSNPNMYTSVRHALMKLIRSSNTWHISKAYRGILPAALGAIPSSALYFGAYESSKITLQQLLLRDNNESTTSKRLVVHGLAAACGNIISSAVFVPKEVIKQQLQYLAATSVSSTHASSSVRGVVLQLIQKKGIKGLYSGYQATLMRNIPSAMIRFVLYEELKILWGYREGKNGKQEKRAPIGLFAAGAVAGAMASGLMTPVDVLKTRMATGTCPLGVKSCMLHVVKEVGWQGLYAGGGSRMMWSGAFSSIGFGTFEFVKGMLGVASINDEEQNL